MGTVIKFPPIHRGRNETPERPDGASAVIIILPVVRIERMPDAPSGAKTAESVSASSSAIPAAKPLAKSEPGRKRRRRPTPVMPSPACGRWQRGG
jgi:hypothetical protein